MISINLKLILSLIIAIIITGLYFSITESFIILSTFGIVIKKWYLVLIFISIVYFLDKKILFNITNQIKYYYILALISAITYLISYNDEILLKIKLLLIYYLPIILCIFLINLNKNEAKYCFNTIIIASALYALLFYLYLIIDTPDRLTINGRTFEFYNNTEWKNPINKVLILRYTFPGIEHGIFMAKLYVLMFCLLYLCLSSYIYLLGYFPVWIIMVLAASRSSFYGILVGFSISLLFIKRQKLKLIVFIIFPIITTISIFSNYYSRNFTFLYAYQPIQMVVDKIFDIDLHKKQIISKVTNEDYHLKNSSIDINQLLNSRNEGSLNKFNQIDLSERTLGWHAVMFNHISICSGLIIILIYILIFIFTITSKEFKDSDQDIYKYLFIVVIPALFIKMLLNQGENEYYPWITLGLLANLTKK